MSTGLKDVTYIGLTEEGRKRKIKKSTVVIVILSLFLIIALAAVAGLAVVVGLDAFNDDNHDSSTSDSNSTPSNTTTIEASNITASNTSTIEASNITASNTSTIEASNITASNTSATGECRTESCIALSNLILTGLDTSVDPCEDFYNFTCGSWVENTVIPDGTYNIGIH